MICCRVTALLRNLRKDRFMHIKSFGIELVGTSFNLLALSATLHRVQSGTPTVEIADAQHR